ncbi:unnamed protein product [Durusdinium trenchii]|uniref:Uncharacterized protein n=2 Tax=Durusdinium trenchii TaxID=1381693 RepID=A0ABP0SXG7_9DINO
MDRFFRFIGVARPSQGVQIGHCRDLSLRLKTAQRTGPVWTADGFGSLFMKATAATLDAGNLVSLMGDELLLAKEELELLWRTTPLNRYFLPIEEIRSKPPDHRPSPVVVKSSEPPRCCPKASTSRAVRLLTRWASVPSTALPSDQRRNGEEELNRLDSVRLDACMARPSACGEGEKGAAPRWECRWHRRPGAATQRPKLTAEGKEYPFIPCTCCERKSPIPRLAKLELGQKAKAAITLYAREAWVEG